QQWQRRIHTGDGRPNRGERRLRSPPHAEVERPGGPVPLEVRHEGLLGPLAKVPIREVPDDADDLDVRPHVPSITETDATAERARAPEIPPREALVHDDGAPPLPDRRERVP